MKFFPLVLLVVFGLTSAYSPFANVFLEEWETYKIKYNKNYSVHEDGLRLKTYLDHKLMVAEHNQRYYEGKETYLIGINHFSDMLPEEKSSFTGFVYEENVKEGAATFIPPHDDVVIPESIDWREKGAVTEVKNQFGCGSCWAFATTGALEGQHFRKTGKLVSLSEQNLLDCDPHDNGCGGGLMPRAFKYIKENGGIDTEESYPYEAINTTCRFKKDSIGATDKGYVILKMFDEEALKKAVATVGPVSVAIEVTDGFHAYRGGIFYDPMCQSLNPRFLDHGVLVVGYGTLDGQDYWRVKNSWGPNWGDNGYILMARNQGNNCGIATLPVYPLV